jgi:hypothetical protein
MGKRCILGRLIRMLDFMVNVGFQTSAHAETDPPTERVLMRHRRRGLSVTINQNIIRLLLAGRYGVFTPVFS